MNLINIVKSHVVLFFPTKQFHVYMPGVGIFT